MNLAPISILTPVYPKEECHPVVFLDRDDTLVPDLPYRSTPDGMTLFPHAGEGLRLLREHGFRLILVSNQSGINRGRITKEQLLAIHQRMEELLAEEGVQLDAAFYCPHTPDEACACRKPLQGMLQAASENFSLDFKRACMIGDKKADIQFGITTGITPIQILLPGRDRIEDAAYAATDLLDAAQWFLKASNTLLKR